MDDRYVKSILDPQVYHCCLVIFLLGSGYYTLQGQLVGGADLGFAVLYAVVSTTIVFLIWHTAYRVVTRLETPRALIFAAVFLVGISGGVIVPLSALLNMVGITGNAALQEHLRETTERYETVLQQSAESALLLLDLAPVLEQESETYRKRYKSEVEYGAYTGVPKAGAVAHTLSSISGQLNKLVQGIKADVAHSKALSDEARDSLKRMRFIALGEGTHDDLLAAIAGEAEKLRLIVAEMNSRGQAVAIQHALESLKSELEMRHRLSGKASVAKSQKEAFQRLGNELTETGTKLAPYAAKLAALPRVQTPVVEQINALEAVIRYSRKFIAQWSAALALDLSPGLILVLVMARVVSRGRQGMVQDEMAAMGPHLLIRAHHVIEGIKRGNIRDGTVLDMEAESLGLEEPDTSEDDQKPEGPRSLPGTSSDNRPTRTPIVKPKGEDDEKE